MSRIDNNFLSQLKDYEHRKMSSVDVPHSHNRKNKSKGRKTSRQVIDEINGCTSPCVIPDWSASPIMEHRETTNGDIKRITPSEIDIRRDNCTTFNPAFGRLSGVWSLGEVNRENLERMRLTSVQATDFNDDLLHEERNCFKMEKTPTENLTNSDILNRFPASFKPRQDISISPRDKVDEWLRSCVVLFDAHTIDPPVVEAYGDSPILPSPDIVDFTDPEDIIMYQSRLVTYYASAYYMYDAREDIASDEFQRGVYFRAADDYEEFEYVPSDDDCLSKKF